MVAEAVESVLVTGGTGFVGAPLVTRLLECGRRVTALDAQYFGPGSLVECLNHPNLRLVHGDVRTVGEDILDGIDAVIHLAALSNDPAGDLRPEWTLEVNRDASVRLAKMAKARGINRFIFASSCSIYGVSGMQLVDEDQPSEPVSVYARAKVEAEQALLALADDKFAPVMMRCATVYGLSPRMRFDLVVNTMTLHAIKSGTIRVHGTGKQWRPLIHVRDLVDAYLRCLETDPAVVGGRCFNVSGANYNVLELAEGIRDCVGGVDIEMVPNNADPRSYRVTSERFERATGFKPVVSLREGVDEIIEALRTGCFGDGTDARYHTVRRLQEIVDLPAVRGGERVRSDFLPFVKPSIGAEEEQEVIETLRSGWITTGPRVERLETMFREYLGVKHAIAVSSCTGALHLSLASLGVGPGDEVITSPITWPTTANVIVHLGATPVFADVERDTLNIDPTQIEARITPRTKAIIPVHIAGQACDMDAIHKIAARYGIPVVEDAAHAIGATYRGRKIGTLSKLSCFSFYPTKNMTTIEGGLITTEDDELADKIRMLSLAGISRDAWKRYGSEASLHWQLHYAGYKYNMTDIQAALGLHQLPKLDRFIERRNAYAQRYAGALSDLPGVTILDDRPWAGHARHLFEILVHPEQLGIDRDGFARALKGENIGVGFHFISLHRQPYYAATLGLQPSDYPNADWVSDRLMSLPLYPSMSDADLESVIAAVRKIALYYAGQPAEALSQEVDELAVHANGQAVERPNTQLPVSIESFTPLPADSVAVGNIDDALVSSGREELAQPGTLR